MTAVAISVIALALLGTPLALRRSGRSLSPDRWACLVMTCMAGGKQFILVTGGGVTEPAELLAFALP